MTIDRRSFNFYMAAALAGSALSPRNANAGRYPAKPVSIITPVGPGGGPDVIARIVADGLTRKWRQQVLVVNRSGAGGVIALQAALAAKPDGYTLFMPLSSTFVVLPVTHPDLGARLSSEETAVGLVGEQPMVIAVNSSFAVNSLAELIGYARSHPGAILFGANRGSLPDLTVELFEKRAGIKLTYVPYSNTAKATQDTSGGTTQLIVESLSGLAGPIKAGLLKPLAIASAKRVADYPNLPTVAEAVPELADFEARGWFAITAPAATPKGIVAKVRGDLNSVLRDTDLQKKFSAMGTYARPLSGAETNAFIAKEQALWKPAVERIFAAAH